MQISVIVNFISFFDHFALYRIVYLQLVLIYFSMLLSLFMN
jgi:hypothetical protein